MARALTGGSEGHSDYDAAMRLVELSANPEQRKEKLEELAAAQLALDEQQDALDVERAELRTEAQELNKREDAAIAMEEANAELAQTLSDRKVALDQETSDRRAADDTTRGRLTDAASAHDRRETKLNTLAQEVSEDGKRAKKLKAKALKSKDQYDAMIAELREIVKREGSEP